MLTLTTSNSTRCPDFKVKGYQIIATTPHDNDCLMEDFDISNPAPYFLEPGRIIWREILQRADGFF
jgi:tRNA (guanosine-2'-O-)-methyltransferase